MASNRRDFIRNVGAGVAILGLPPTGTAADAVPRAPGRATPAGKPAGLPAYGASAYRRKEGWPIRSELKSKRIRFDKPQNQVSWAYMKELRENNRTRKIYPVNPYVEVYQFRDNAFELFSENCDGLGDFYMHLVVGPERALLIDTGFGLGNVNGLVDQITGGKPIVVALTHEHPDHAFGACRFDTVHCHEYLVPYLELQNEHQWDYLFDDYGDNVWLQFDRADLPAFRQYNIAGVKDGHVFDLGGNYKVELVYTGGHSAGHAAFLDRSNRILYTGDNICSDISSCGSVNVTRPGPHGENTALAVYRDNVRRLVDRMDEYDYIFPNHFMTNIENNLMPNILAACDEILADPGNCDYRQEKWNKGGTESSVTYFKFIRGFSVIAYRYEKALA